MGWQFGRNAVRMAVKARDLPTAVHDFVQGNAGTRRAVLDYRDMEALVKRADFPAKRLAAA